MRSIKLRIKDAKLSKRLTEMANDVNFVWNFLNDVYKRKWEESRASLHKFDPFLNSLINGSSSQMSIDARTIQFIRDRLYECIGQQGYKIKNRCADNNPWIPFRAKSIRFSGGSLYYSSLRVKVWESHRVKMAGLVCGSFTMDQCGKWFVSLTYKDCADHKPCGSGGVGVDLGLSKTATTSSGAELCVSDLKIIDKKEIPPYRGMFG